MMKQAIYKVVHCSYETEGCNYKISHSDYKTENCNFKTIP